MAKFSLAICNLQLSICTHHCEWNRCARFHIQIDKWLLNVLTSTVVSEAARHTKLKSQQVLTAMWLHCTALRIADVHRREIRWFVKQSPRSSVNCTGNLVCKSDALCVCKHKKVVHQMETKRQALNCSGSRDYLSISFLVCSRCCCCCCWCCCCSFCSFRSFCT